MQRNLCLIQDPQTDASRARAPLFLVHDGSGTAFSYYRLERLDRRVYTIWNPRFESGRPWPGGIRQMAQVYTELMLTRVPVGPVLLGGWSLGGLISLEMAHYLSRKHPGVTVSGVLMLDSGYPASPGSLKKTICTSTRVALDKLELRSQMMIRLMLKQSIQLIEKWQPPQWNLKAGGCYDQQCDCQHDAADLVMDHTGAAPMPPPVTLLKCQQKSRCDDGTGGNHFERVDIFRDCPSLGWNHSHPGLVTSTYDLHCSHFEAFDPPNVAATSHKLRMAIDDIEQSKAPVFPPSLFSLL